MIAVAVAALISVAPVQDPPPGPPPHRPPPPPQGEALRVFLDCNFCDDDYLRTEIRFVNYVRDRADAQLHVLVTRQSTGSGGNEYTFAFLGLRELAGRGDTLRTTTSGTATSDERRNAIARTLRLGLVRFVAATPLAERIEIRFTPPDSASAAASRPRDRWNFWVFRVGLNGFFNGESSYRYQSLNTNASANRTTERSKFSFEIYRNTNRERYATSDTTTFTAVRESWGSELLMVRSWGPHWSIGGYGELRHETYRNIDLRGTVLGAIEYSVFPYSESTRRLLLLRWGLGPELNRYADTTIYDRVRESRMTHRAEVEYTVTQPWGTAEISSEFKQYWHDLKKLSLDTRGEISLRLVRGLNLEIWGGYEVVRDQLYLPAEGASPEEIIARQRALATDYFYYGSLGLSYRFGSIFNNVVNPRFGN